MGGHLFRNWTGEIVPQRGTGKKGISHKKAHNAQNRSGLTYVPFCG
jgi:hypothetical protein